MKKYWKDIESKKSKEVVSGVEKTSDENPLFELFNDRRNYLPASRRDFLKLCGFSFAVSALSSCQSKISKAVPYVIAPNEITPGKLFIMHPAILTVMIIAVLLSKPGMDVR